VRPKELRTAVKNLTLWPRGFIMGDGTSESSESTPICSIPLCGRDAEWEVEMFGKMEYYCMRHKPGVPEKFMTRTRPEATAPKPTPLA